VVAVADHLHQDRMPLLQLRQEHRLILIDHHGRRLIS
jgi:hypothetical protein